VGFRAFLGKSPKVFLPQKCLLSAQWLTGIWTAHDTLDSGTFLPNRFCWNLGSNTPLDGMRVVMHPITVTCSRGQAWTATQCVMAARQSSPWRLARLVHTSNRAGQLMEVLEKYVAPGGSAPEGMDVTLWQDYANTVVYSIIRQHRNAKNNRSICWSQIFDRFSGTSP
jgi:hypothetical protein